MKKRDLVTKMVIQAVYLKLKFDQKKRVLKIFDPTWMPRPVY